jgi:hypothetical protein
VGGAAAAAAATQLEVLDFASSLFAGEPKSDEKPLVSVGFSLRESGSKWYPSGTPEMLRQIRVDYEAILAKAAKELDMRLDIVPGVLDAAAYLERVKQTQPDGQIIMALDYGRWPPVLEVLKNRGKIPTIVYANVSHNRLDFLGKVPVEPGMYLGSTHDVNWLNYAMRMLNTLWRVKRVRFLDCPCEGYAEAFAKAAASDEIRAVADFYARNAKKIVEPTAAHILEAAKNYIALRTLIRDGKYDGVTVGGALCTGADGPNANPACLALSKLLDEGIVAACEHDKDAAMCQFLTLSLFDLPGLMGNTSADTVHNWVYVTHCTSALKLEGVHKEYRAPFVLRDFHNVGGGVTPMVAWPLGKRATLLDGNKSFVINAGVVTANTDDVRQPPCGGCRTTVAFALDGVEDALHTRVGAGHAWCVMADIVRPFLAYCQLAGHQVVNSSGKRLVASPRVTKDAWDSAIAMA